LDATRRRRPLYPHHDDDVVRGGKSEGRIGTNVYDPISVMSHLYTFFRYLMKTMSFPPYETYYVLFFTSAQGVIVALSTILLVHLQLRLDGFSITLSSTKNDSTIQRIVPILLSACFTFHVVVSK
jgi:hypothetical protein